MEETPTPQESPTKFFKRPRRSRRVGPRRRSVIRVMDRHEKRRHVVQPNPTRPHELWVVPRPPGQK